MDIPIASHLRILIKLGWAFWGGGWEGLECVDVGDGGSTDTMRSQACQTCFLSETQGRDQKERGSRQLEGSPYQVSNLKNFVGHVKSLWCRKPLVYKTPCDNSSRRTQAHTFTRCDPWQPSSLLYPQLFSSAKNTTNQAYQFIYKHSHIHIHISIPQTLTWQLRNWTSIQHPSHLVN